MRAFQVFIVDDRYSVPTLSIIHADTVELAARMAERLMADSPHHLGVEVFDEGVCVFRMGEAGRADAEEA